MCILDSIPQVEVNEEMVKNFENNDDFSSITVELAKEICSIATIIFGARMTKSEIFDRKTAIIYGLGVQLNKIYFVLLESYCQKRREIVMIFIRCFFELYIELINFLNFPEDDTYTDFMKKSLKADYIFYKEIDKNIRKNGEILPIEERMKKSIERCFEYSELTMDEVKNYKPESIKTKFEKNQRKIVYDGLYRMSSHSIHPNWTNILTNNLLEEDDGYKIDYLWNEPDIRMLAPIIIFYCEAIVAFLKILSYDEIYEMCNERINLIMEKAQLLNEYHEKFIQKIALNNKE